jgi:hypothetical protein
MARFAARTALGYLRYDTDAEVKVLNELYSHLRLYVNFFQPQMKLVSKTRTGAKVTKRYDAAQTPYRRLLASKIPAKAKRALTEQYLELNPAELKREIARCQDKLVKIARKKTSTKMKEVKRPTRSGTFRVRQRKAG